MEEQKPRSGNNKLVIKLSKSSKSDTTVKIKEPSKQEHPTVVRDQFSSAQKQGNKIQQDVHHDDDDDELEDGEIREDEAVNNIDDNSSVVNQADDHLDQDQGKLEIGLRVCHICGKTFHSGKALGGHMRVHSEGQKPKPDGKPNSQAPSPTEVGPIKCNLCNKEFKSDKSLYGHMRFHPDRRWRGMQPPPELDTTPPVVVNKTTRGEVSCSDEPSREIVKWGKKDARGRLALAAAPSSEGSASSSGPDSGAEIAANILILLANSLVGSKRVLPLEDDNVKGKKVKRCDPDELYYLQNMGVSVDNEDEESPTIKIKKGGKKVVKGMEEKEEVHEEVKWKCTTCNKTFPTHQALGGHKSSHYKEKNNPINVNSSNTLVDESGLTDVGPGISGAGENNNGNGGGGCMVHRCKQCDKTFPTGQALGGHQRCHYVPTSSSSPDQSSNYCQMDSGRAKENVFEFDLNELAPEMLEDQEEDGAVDSSLKSL